MECLYMQQGRRGGEWWCGTFPLVSWKEDSSQTWENHCITTTGFCWDFLKTKSILVWWKKYLWTIEQHLIWLASENNLHAFWVLWEAKQRSVLVDNRKNHLRSTLLIQTKTELTEKRYKNFNTFEIDMLYLYRSFSRG